MQNAYDADLNASTTSSGDPEHLIWLEQAYAAVARRLARMA